MPDGYSTEAPSVASKFVALELTRLAIANQVMQGPILDRGKAIAAVYDAIFKVVSEQNR